MSNPSYEIEPGDGGVWIHTTKFVEEFKDEIKDEIPAANRKWDDDKEAWWVDEDWQEAAEEIAARHYDEG